MRRNSHIYEGSVVHKFVREKTYLSIINFVSNFLKKSVRYIVFHETSRREHGTVFGFGFSFFCSSVYIQSLFPPVLVRFVVAVGIYGILRPFGCSYIKV